jgi:Protein of unknown function (DUF1501)
MSIPDNISRTIHEQLLSRRDFLSDSFTGFAGIGLASMLLPDLFEGKTVEAAGVLTPHHRPRAKRVLQIFCPGAASHMDMWEHKPMLEKYHGTKMPGEEDMKSFQGANGGIMRSPWTFERFGKSGKMLSPLLKHMGQHVDDIAFVHSMVSKTNTHGPGCVFMNTGQVNEGFPSAGAWYSFAMGSMNENLPTYVSIPDMRGEPPNGKANWSNGFLPAQYQAIVMAEHRAIRNINLPPEVTAAEEQASRALLIELNEQHAEDHPGNSELDARMASYELAARMQLSAPEVSDLESEPDSVHTLYGTRSDNRLKASYARNCLLARRLLERDVRYVNLYCGSRASGVDGLLNWDAHKTLKTDYERHCAVFDQPTAALLTDLKRTGMLDDTLVLWNTEFGRMPTHQAGTSGRDHNPDGFTCWMMGAGVKGGVTYGATDDLGRRAVENPVTVWDYYATVLDILGFDHERLTYYFNGNDRRLTDVHGHSLSDILS